MKKQDKNYFYQYQDQHCSSHTFTNMYNIFECCSVMIRSVLSSDCCRPFSFFSYSLLYFFISFSFICISLYDSDIYGRIDNSYIIVDDAENDDDVNVHHFFYSTPKKREASRVQGDLTEKRNKKVQKDSFLYSMPFVYIVIFSLFFVFECHYHHPHQ